MATPTPTPENLPLLLTEESSNRAIALDAVSWLRAPFSVFTSSEFSQDGHTRVTFFALNVKLQAGEDASVMTAQAEDASQKIYPLAVEYVGQVPGFDWLTQVMVKLPDGMANAGDVQVSIRLRGVASNKVLVRIGP